MHRELLLVLLLCMQLPGIGQGLDYCTTITEFGAEALGGFHADADTRWSEEYQEAFFRNQLQLLSTIDGLRGTSPWILVDFRSPKRLNPGYQDGWNRKGLYTETGKKKKAFFVMRNFYDSLQVRYNK